MSTTVAKVFAYPKGIKNLIDTLDLPNGYTSLRVVPLNSTYVYDNTDEFVSDLTGELTTNGASRLTLTNVTVTISTNTVSIDCDDIQWTAAGGDLTARGFAVYDNTGGADSSRKLLLYILFDENNLDVVATNGRVLKYIVPVGGLFKLKQQGVA